jgi:hypothetical protein
VSDDNCVDDIEKSSVTESDTDSSVVEIDDPFFEDPKNNNKLSKKLNDEVCSPFPLLTIRSPLALASYLVRRQVNS